MHISNNEKHAEYTPEIAALNIILWVCGRFPSIRSVKPTEYS